MLTPYEASSLGAARRRAEHRGRLVERDRRAAQFVGLARGLLRAGILPGWYLRLGLPPDDGYSRSYTQSPEAGISVLPVMRTREGHFVIPLSGERHLGGEVLRLFYHDDRPAYFVKGNRLPRLGSAHEPLLSSITAIEPVAPESIVAADPASAAVEDWNERRGGPLRERPGFLALFEPRPPRQRTGRNDPCPCGSGKKYKRCCGLVEEGL